MQSYPIESAYSQLQNLQTNFQAAPNQRLAATPYIQDTVTLSAAARNAGANIDAGNAENDADNY